MHINRNAGERVIIKESTFKANERAFQDYLKDLAERKRQASAKQMQTKTSSMFSPTLWKTCRVLAEPRHLQLLRHLHLHEEEGHTIKTIAESLSLPQCTAGRYLKELQARGLCRVTRISVFGFYSINPDWRVSQAAPILGAVLDAFENGFTDEDIIAEMTAYTYRKRPEFLRFIHDHPNCTFADLMYGTRNSYMATDWNLAKLVRRGIVEETKQGLRLLPPRNPLAAVLREIALSLPGVDNMARP